MKFGTTLAFLLAALNGQATLISPGGTGVPNAIPTPASETLLADNANLAWSTPGAGGVGAATGTYSDAVYRNSGGTLDFVYQFTNASTSSGSVSQTTGLSFTGFTTDVSFLTNGSALPGGIFVNGTAAPIAAARDGLGSTVGFSFFPPTTANIVPGTTSTVLLISTNGTNYSSAGLVGVIVGGTANLAGFQPLSVVPEPSLFLPLGAGLLTLIAFRRRRAHSCA